MNQKLRTRNWNQNVIHYVLPDNNGNAVLEWNSCVTGSYLRSTYGHPILNQATSFMPMHVEFDFDHSMDIIPPLSLYIVGSLQLKMIVLHFILFVDLNKVHSMVMVIIFQAVMVLMVKALRSVNPPLESMGYLNELVIREFGGMR